MIRIDPTLNPLEVMIITDYYKTQGVESYTLIPGNGCIWSYHGRINEYFIFNGGKLIDIQVD